MSQVLGEASLLKWTSFIKSRRVTMRLWRLLVVSATAVKEEEEKRGEEISLML
jgi:hypothetical protein